MSRIYLYSLNSIIMWLNLKENFTKGVEKLKTIPKKGIATLATVAALSGALTSCNTGKIKPDNHIDSVESVQPRSRPDSLNFLDQQIANNEVSEDEKIILQEKRDELALCLSTLNALKAHIGKPIYAVKRFGAPSDITYYYTDKNKYDLHIQDLKTTKKGGADWVSYDGYEELEVKTLDQEYLDSIFEEYATNPLYWFNWNDFFRSQLKK